MNNDLETTLDICLNEIEGGYTSVDECLARYPEQAAELKPLLLAATRLSRARVVMPDPVFKTRARTQLNVYMQQYPQRKRISPILWRYSVALMTMVLLLIASGTAFAQSAVPGDPLYDWKLTSEQVWSFTSSDPLSVDIAVADRRMSELIAVSGDRVRQAQAVKNYKQILVKLNAEQDEKKRERILPVLQSQHETLKKAGISLPELEMYFLH